MGYLLRVSAQDDPDGLRTDGSVYTFEPIEMQQEMGWGRREGIAAIPGMDDVADAYSGGAGPLDVRPFRWQFRVFGERGFDPARDRFLRAVASPAPQTLAYLTDAGTLRFTVGTLRRQELVATSESYRYVDLAATWRVRPDWRPRRSEAEDSWGDDEGTFAPDSSETFVAPGYTPLLSADQTVLVDARGTAGVALPHLPDAAPKIVLTGPCGGDGGIRVSNTSDPRRDGAGGVYPARFLLPFKLPTAADIAVVDIAGLAFTRNGIPFRPVREAYQADYIRVLPGIQNVWKVSAVGLNQLSGGSITVDWWRKFL